MCVKSIGAGNNQWAASPARPARDSERAAKLPAVRTRSLQIICPRSPIALPASEVRKNLRRDQQFHGVTLLGVRTAHYTPEVSRFQATTSQNVRGQVISRGKTGLNQQRVSRPLIFIKTGQALQRKYLPHAWAIISRTHASFASWAQNPQQPRLAIRSETAPAQAPGKSALPPKRHCGKAEFPWERFFRQRHELPLGSTLEKIASSQNSGAVIESTNPTTDISNPPLWKARNCTRPIGCRTGARGEPKNRNDSVWKPIQNARPQFRCPVPTKAG